jgi:4-carboxymuconolactone decarboxylase
MSPRIPPVVPGSRAELKAIESSIVAERGHINLLYQVLLNSPPLVSGWEKLLTAIRNQNSIPADLREMVMVRVAVLNRAPYEIEAHAPLARKAGVSEAKVQGLHDDEPGTVFTPLERAVLALADSMTRNVQVPDAIFEPLRKHFDVRALLELVATVAAYNMVSRLLEALRIGH